MCCRSRGYRRLVPDLRISGRWLQRAGFDLGQHYEIEVRAGRLTIRAV
ncbi:MAG TPA: SymE family type I addiction module toxin [Thermoanaerobaculia bacterium]|nr:SymE family type I addiction module toxin [Thermoanaerobaculia bacterium]